MQPSILWVAYIANIVILVPVCWSMFFGGGVGAVFDGRVAESAGLRIMVGSLWTAILVASVIGLFAPAAMAPFIAAQVLYKSIWLLAFIRPAMKLGGWESVPHGITLCFLAIVLTYPFLLGAHVLRAPDRLTSFSATAATSAPPDAVWALWTDPESWACWDKGLARAEGTTITEAGDVGQIFPGNGRPANYVVSAYEPGQSYAFDTALPGATLRVTRRFTGSQPTRFAHEIEFNGFLGGLWARMLAPSFQKALPPTLDALARQAESGACGDQRVGAIKTVRALPS